jgi:hypothetical protein
MFEYGNAQAQKRPYIQGRFVIYSSIFSIWRRQIRGRNLYSINVRVMTSPIPSSAPVMTTNRAYLKVFGAMFDFQHI